MNIGKKLTLGYLLVASLAGFITFTALRSYSNIETAFVRLTDDPVKLIKALEDLRLTGFRIVTSTAEIGFLVHQTELVDRDAMIAEEERELAVEGIEAYQASLAHFGEEIDTSDESEVTTMREIDAAGNDLIKTSNELITLLKKHASSRELFEKKEEFENEESVYVQRLDEALAEEYSELTTQKQNVHLTILSSTRITYLVTFLIFLMAVVSGWYISRSISSRINKLRKASELVGSGHLELQIEIGSNDEITELALSFNNMIGDLKESRNKLLASEERFRSVVDSANDAIISTDHTGGILSWNNSARKIFGYSLDEILGKSISVLFPPFYSTQLVDSESGHLLTSRIMHTGSKATELKGVKKDGNEFPLEISVSSWETAEGNSYSGIIRDVTERRSLEDQLTYQTLHDPLTKLANRVLFGDRVAHALEKISRNHALVSVLFLDLDNFKTINDSLGHAAGDDLLLSVANRLQACLRPHDTAARLGGDEFAVLLEDSTDLKGGTIIAERLQDILRTPFLLDGKEVFVSVSIGIATTSSAEEDPAALLRNADLAMYIAKSEGKDRYAVFENEMHEIAVRRFQLEADMRQAIEHEDFEVYYQPIIDLQSEKIIGMEALTRWNHPERGLVPPLDFIPIAEETNLILPLGRWILEEACRQARKWQIECERGDDLAITVNISSRQFQDGALVATVTEALQRSGLSAGSLILEITESTMLNDTDATSKKLNELKDLGVRLAIDDFGTGYSSFSYLQRFPVDFLKIDKSFIDKIELGNEGSAVTKAIITMSNTLHLTTIAEGIESPGQRSSLQTLGCEMGQGYHFAKPLRRDDMTEFLHRSFSKPHVIKESLHLDRVNSMTGRSTVVVI
jgi:diguanylate cyclase (GGDEF)-like protein/PAS domain S-box-containing protein